ncbi:MAG: DUF2791 family P-loop domain-containing protein [Euryarchaeota archaeon]|nr:DUF2791 family P-loop domain-containing protein [Euryarchaeota archaeon]
MAAVKFVGRSVELAALKAHLDAARKGGSRFALVSGEAGAGKARLVEELVAKHAKGLIVAKHFTLERERRVPFSAFADIIAQLSRAGHAPGDAVRGLSGDGRRSSESLSKERDRLFRGVQEFFEGLPASIIFMADMNNLDDGSTAMFQYLASNMKGGKMLFAGTYAPDMLEDPTGAMHPLAEALASIMVEGKVATLPLDRMSRDDVSKLTAARLDVKSVPASFLEVVWKVTEGNPLYVVETLDALVEQGLDVALKDWARKFDPSRTPIPASIKDAISARFSKLDDRERAVLRTAAVMGAEFRAGPLLEVSGLPKDDLQQVMQSLVSHKFVYEVTEAAEETYRFEHSQVRDIVCESVGADAKGLHGKIAPVLERLAGRRPFDDAYSLAYHFDLADIHDKAAMYGLMAGQKAFGVSAASEGLRYAEAGLRHVKLVEPSKNNTFLELSLRKLAGDLRFHLGDWDASLRDLDTAFHLAEKVVSPEMMSAASSSMGDLQRFRGNYEDAERNFARALDIAEGAEDARGKAMALRGLGYCAWRTGDYGGAERRFSECVPVAEKLGDMALKGSLLLEMGNVHTSRGDLDEAERSYKSSIEFTEKAGAFYDMARAYNNIGDIYLQRERWEEAIGYFEKCAGLADRLGNRDMLGWAHFNLGEAYAKKGELDKAEKECLLALEILARMDDMVGMAGIYKNLGIVNRFRKDWDKSEAMFRKSADMEEEMKTPHPLAETLIEWGAMRIERGDKGGAAEILRKAEDIAASIKAEKLLERARAALKKVG